MLKNTLYLIIIAALCFFSCVREKEQFKRNEKHLSHQNHHSNDAILADSSKQPIGIIHGIPPEIDGCGCLYSSDSVKYLSKEFIFCDNYEYGILEYKQNRILVPFKSWTDEGNGNTTKYYSNNDLYIVIKTKDVDSTDEEYTSEGNIYLYESKKLIFTTKLSGKCGC